MNNHFCGFDFGTTNSAIGIRSQKHQLELVPLEGTNTIIPSALFFDYKTSKFFYGQNALDKYIQGDEGRLLMSLKSILGTDTIVSDTRINGIDFSFHEIFGFIFRNIKSKAEQLIDSEINQVVLGRPVFFNKNDSKKDKRAQNILVDIARQQGFKTVEFQFEPIAAALAYETTIKKEQIGLIVDIGGGTSDFSVIRLKPKREQMDCGRDILSNLGAYIGGNTFDKLISINNIMPYLGRGSTYKSTTRQTLDLPASLYKAFSTWHRIDSLYNDQEKDFLRDISVTSSHPQLIQRFLYALEYELGHTIISTVESAKIKLSDTPSTSLNFTMLNDPFKVILSKEQLIENIADKIVEISNLVTEALRLAGVTGEAIDTLFFTGGSTKIKTLRDLISNAVPHARIIEGDAFGSVAMGLTIDAKRRFLS